MIEREHRAVFTEQLQQRRRGRPRTAAPQVRTSVMLPTEVYDALCRRAHVERKSLHALLCQALSCHAR